MKTALVRSRCECQARLVAKLNEQCHIIQAYAANLEDQQQPAPSHSMNADRDRFDIGWLCSFCGRNTMRSFYKNALIWKEEPSAEPLPPEG